jgi:predicted Rossmann-fold nucleotide-binding protein
MEAVSRGAKEAGGSVIGVTTSWFAHLKANAWVDQEVCTATFLERLQTLIEMGQGYLALQGGIGTLTEISLVWSMLQTQSIPARPFVLLSNPWQQLLQFCTDTLIIRPSDFGYLQLASAPEDAVRALTQSLQRRDTQLQ